MIAVTLLPERFTDLPPLYDRALRAGAPMVELRLDALTRPLEAVKWFAYKRHPTAIVTCRRPQDGGRWTLDETRRRELLRQASAILPATDFIDWELDVASEIPRVGRTRRLISFHDMEGTPARLDELWLRMADLDPDLIKIVTMPKRVRDTSQILRLVRHAQRPTVAFCMGELGSASRVLCLREGAPFTYAALDQSVAPGQPTLKALTDTYRVGSLQLGTSIFGVVGDPVAHSRGPLIHNRAFDSVGKNSRYLRFMVPRGELETFLQEAPAMGVLGLSVTIPHKAEALRLAWDAEPYAKRVGAANTLIAREQGWVAANTDAPGLLAALQAALGPTQSLRGARVLILGAGGVARAAVVAAKDAGAAVMVAARKVERAETLLDDLGGGEALSWEARLDAEYTVLINATPVGMEPQTAASPMPPSALNPAAVVLDTVYTPARTQLLQDAAAAGCTTVSGVELFLRQAALQLQLFIGASPPLRLLRDFLNLEGELW